MTRSAQQTAEQVANLLGGLPTMGGLAVLMGAAAVLYLATWFGVLRLVDTTARRTATPWDDRFLRHQAPHRLALVPSAVLLNLGISSVVGVPPNVVVIVERGALAVVVISVAWAIFGALDAVNDLYGETEYSASRPITGYLQLGKLLVAIVAAILVIARLADQSPWLLLSGLGAATAILLLVFRDTILALVASVQLATNDMINVGDWVTIPVMDVDGVVSEIALHSITIRNFDETVAFVPTHRVINEPFKNWRGMIDAGGRRFVRKVHVDAGTVRTVDDELRARWADDPQVGPAVEDARTNLALYREHVLAWARSHDGIYSDGRFPLLARMPDPTPSGIPVELYGFATSTAWADYERIQAEVTEHLYLTLADFGLRAYQYPAS